VSGFFYNLGRALGRKAVPAMRKSKFIWDGVTGTEDEALRAEVSLGKDMAAELRATVELVVDPQTVLLASDICRRLGACVRDKRRTFQCELFRDGFPNALALPGGFLFLSDSLIGLCKHRPEELAFVIGHEMAHVILGHAWNRMFNETALRVASFATSRVGQLGGWLRQQGMVLLRTAHARNEELEADELGLRLAAAAGFSPAGTVTLLQRLELLGRNPVELGQYLVSHPAPSERMAHLQSLVRQLSDSQAIRRA
jgi:beta-barrel assembly-enhancing protease